MTTGRPLIVAALVVVLLTAAVPPTQASGGGELLVGFNGPVNTLLIKLLGGTVLDTMPEISVAHVWSSDVTRLAGRLLGTLGVAYVETNDGLRLAGSSPDASSWDASSWDASSWDASSWDASSWDASSWDASSWDASSWDASSWDASSWDGAIDPAYGIQWGLGAANFPDAWQLGNGDPATRICVLDTGVEASHPDLAGHVLPGFNAMGGGTSTGDDVGHGTHVAGIITALQGNGVGITGATSARVVPIKVMNAAGGSEDDLARGLIWCAKNGGRVASMSLHIDAHSESVERAVRYAQNRGLLVVAAAGNAALDSVSYPAAYPGVLAVGAVTPSGDLAGFSNHGAGLDLVAPGYRIASTFTGGGYAAGSGTSQAAPHVSAAASIAWALHPSWSAADVAAALTSTARDFGDAGWDATYGHGALDAGAAATLAAS